QLFLRSNSRRSPPPRKRTIVSGVPVTSRILSKLNEGNVDVMFLNEGALQWQWPPENNLPYSSSPIISNGTLSVMTLNPSASSTTAYTLYDPSSRSGSGVQFFRNECNLSSVN